MLKYIGNGNFLAGVPARDLTGEEVIQFGGKARLVRSGLWVIQDLTPRREYTPSPFPEGKGSESKVVKRGGKFNKVTGPREDKG